jgi:enoyl-CoA hydratase/carnithine racemase
MQVFADAIEEAHSLKSLCTVIVTGAGRAFVSGGDLSELQHYHTREGGLRLATLWGTR